MRPTRSCEAFIDGASRGNPGPAGIGVVLKDGAGPGRQLSRYLGETTNNVAEYLALVYALQLALKEGYGAVAVYTDSELLARQMTGRYKVRDAHLRLFHDLALELAQGFTQFTIQHIPRARNSQADRLAGQAVRGRPAAPGRSPGILKADLFL